MNLSVLEQWLGEDPQNFSELGVSCGNFIDTWLEAGGEPTDDAVIGFYGIWSESLDVPQGVGDAQERADFYAWAYPQYILYREEVRTLIAQMPRQP